MCGNALVRSTKKMLPCLQSSKVVVASWSGAACLLLVLGSCISLRETWIPTCAVMPSLQKLFPNITTTPNTPPRWQLPCCWRWRWWSGQVCLQTWTLLSTCGDSSSGRCRSTMCLASISSVISLWRIGRGCQQQPVQLWWIPRPGGLRHKYCPYKILTLCTQVWHVHLGCTHFCCQFFGQ